MQIYIAHTFCYNNHKLLWASHKHHSCFLWSRGTFLAKLVHTPPFYKYCEITTLPRSPPFFLLWCSHEQIAKQQHCPIGKHHQTQIWPPLCAYRTCSTKTHSGTDLIDAVQEHLLEDRQWSNPTPCDCKSRTKPLCCVHLPPRQWDDMLKLHKQKIKIQDPHFSYYCILFTKFSIFTKVGRSFFITNNRLVFSIITCILVMGVEEVPNTMILHGFCCIRVKRSRSFCKLKRHNVIERFNPRGWCAL